MRIRDIVISVTNNCNAKCIMCGIWKLEEKDDFHPDLITGFPKSIRNITLSGGEPFLCKNLIQIIEKIKKSCTYSRIVISTNGILTDLIQNKIKEILKIVPRVAIRVSLDGTEDIHNKIRGHSQAYTNAIRTIALLKKLGIKDLGAQFIITNENISQLIPVYNLTKTLKINFNCQIAHSSDFYFRINNPEVKDTDALIRELNYIIYSELRTFDAYKLFKTYYYRGIINYLNYSLRRNDCLVGSLFCYLNTKGEVYPCIMLNEKMGDLRENSLQEIWRSKNAVEVREKVKNCSISCWLICTVAPAIKNNPFRILPWIIKNKVKAHLRFGF